MNDTDDQLKHVKGMLVGIEITVLGIAIGGAAIPFRTGLMFIIGAFLVLFGVLRTAVAAAAI